MCNEFEENSEIVLEILLIYEYFQLDKLYYFRKFKYIVY